MKRISQRQVIPASVKSRLLGDIVQLSNSAQGSATISAPNGEVLFEGTASSRSGSRLTTHSDMALYEGSVAAANRIPGGSAVTAGTYQIIGPWRDWNDTDGSNVKDYIYVRNKVTSTGSIGTHVTDGNDDGYDDPNASPSWSYNDVAIATGSGAGRDLTCGVRIAGTNVPQGATIDSAILKFKCASSGVDDVLTRIYGIDEDNTANFTSSPLGRPLTTASVQWHQVGVTVNVTYTPPSIISIVQEIVDRPGWASGNAMGFLVYDDGSADANFHVWYAYEALGINGSVELDVSYTDNGPDKTVIAVSRARAILNDTINP